MSGVTPKNDAYGGGSIIRSAPPTSGPQGGFGALSGVPGGGPVGGVNPPAQPFFARPNEGTNVRIPYSRVVPLSDPRGGGLRDTMTAEDYFSNNKQAASFHPGGFYSKEVMSETDTLHPTRLAFVLAKRSGNGPMSVADPNNAGGKVTSSQQDISYAINSTMAPQLPGADRFQKLCSFEYLQRYVSVTVNHSHKSVIKLGEAKYVPLPNKLKDAWGNGLLRSLVERAVDRSRTVATKMDLGPGIAGVYSTPGVSAPVVAEMNLAVKAAVAKDFYEMDTRLMKMLEAVAEKADADGNNPDAKAKFKEQYFNVVSTQYPSDSASSTMLDSVGHYDPTKKVLGFSGLPLSDATMLNIGDLSKRTGEFMSPINMDPTIVADPTNGSLSVKGKALFVNGRPMDEHPYRLQGIFTMDKTAFLRGRGIDSEIVEASTVAKFGTGYPFGVSRNLGDEVAFAMLEKELVRIGLHDWTPDGILLSKLDNVPQDSLEDQRIDARDGMLYNLSIQGPCLATNWTGKTEMAVLPMDKVFVLVTADVWHGQFASIDTETQSQAVDVLPQTLSIGIEAEVNKLLSKRPEPVVMQVIYEILFKKNVDLKKLGTKKYPSMILSNEVFLDVMSKDGDGSIVLGDASAFAYALDKKLDDLKKIQPGTKEALAAALVIEVPPSLNDYNKSSFAHFFIDFRPKIEKLMAEAKVNQREINTFEVLVGFDPSAGNATKAKGGAYNEPVIGKNWFPDLFERNNDGDIVLTKPYANITGKGDLVNAIEGYYTLFARPLLTGGDAEIDKLVDALKSRTTNGDQQKGFSQTLYALYSTPSGTLQTTSSVFKIANGMIEMKTDNKLVNLPYTDAVAYVQKLFDRFSPIGFKSTGNSIPDIPAIKEALESINEYRTENQLDFQTKIKGEEIYGVKVDPPQKYPVPEARYATYKNGTNAEGVSKWLFGASDASYEAYLKAKAVLMNEFALKKGAKGTFFRVSTSSEVAADPTKLIINDPGSMDQFDAEAEIERSGSKSTKMRRQLTNFNLRLSTSSEMISDSGLAFSPVGRDQTQRSRMGLKLSNRVSEYVVGGWCIGTVMDSAASRSSGSLGANLGVRTAPNTAAHSVHVNIEWWSGDKLYRNYANVEDLTRARHAEPKKKSDDGDRGAAALPTDHTFDSGLSGMGTTYAYGPEKKVNRPTEGFYEKDGNALLKAGMRSILQDDAEKEGFLKIAPDRS